MHLRVSHTAAALAGLVVALVIPASAATSATIIVTNTNDSGPGSLRAAIELANATPGPNTIGFAIPPTDPGHNGLWSTIRPLSPLPWLSDGGTTVDGSSQTTFGGDTNPLGPEIEINGSLTSKNGLTLASDANRLHSLVVNGFVGGGAGISIRGGSSNVITASFVGLDATGAIAVPNRFHGIDIQTGTGNVVGGVSAADRNVISGNAGQGVSISSAGNVVEGNYIGTDRTGSLDLGNQLSGVFVFRCEGPGADHNLVRGNVISGNDVGVWLEDRQNEVRGNRIGTNAAGTGPLGNSTFGIMAMSAPAVPPGPKGPGCVPSSGDANVIAENVVSANGGSGIALFSNPPSTSDDNAVRGNMVGTDVDGRVVPGMGNGGTGIDVRGGVANRIGGTAAGEANLVAGNALSGVAVSFGATRTLVEGNTVRGNARTGVAVFGPATTDNAIRLNEIFSNGALGIDLGGDGVTPNDPDDLDTGPNKLQNFPVLLAARSSGHGTRVRGTLNSTPRTTFVLEFFSNAACDPAGHGEGESLLGSRTVKTNAKGNAHFTFATGLPPGSQITATATDPGGNTSEFSACHAVAGDGENEDENEDDNDE